MPAAWPQVACLFGRNPGQGQQLQRSQDAKERCAYFVAHGRQKLRLGLARRFGALLGIDQRCLHLPERRHIADQAEDHRFAPWVVGVVRTSTHRPSPAPAHAGPAACPRPRPARTRKHHCTPTAGPAHWTAAGCDRCTAPAPGPRVPCPAAFGRARHRRRRPLPGSRPKPARRVAAGPRTIQVQS